MTLASYGRGKIIIFVFSRYFFDSIYCKGWTAETVETTEGSEARKNLWCDQMINLVGSSTHIQA